MQRDLQLRAAARAIYKNVYPTEELDPVDLDQAERFGTVHYRQAVGAAQEGRAVLAARHKQFLLAAILQGMTLGV